MDYCPRSSWIAQRASHISAAVLHSDMLSTCSSSIASVIISCVSEFFCVHTAVSSGSCGCGVTPVAISNVSFWVRIVQIWIFHASQFPLLSLLILGVELELLFVGVWLMLETMSAAFSRALARLGGWASGNGGGGSGGCGCGAGCLWLDMI